ncbi:MAG: TonB-dependent receptor [Paludibacteraceae bacterium]
MKKTVFICTALLLSVNLIAQNAMIKGRVIDRATNKPVSGVTITLLKQQLNTLTNAEGKFKLQMVEEKDEIIRFSGAGYTQQSISIKITKNQELNLGDIALEKDIKADAEISHLGFQRENSFELSAIDESTQDEDADIAGQNFSTLATLSNDPYLSEVGYNLSGFRFSPRGYKNKYAQTYLNGVEFNSLMRGNFNYSMLGAMNDVTRNSTTQDYLQASLFSFGDLAGTQNYDLRAGSYARGTKITATYTNRNYQQRLMLSHHTGLNRNGWAFSALVGGRYAYEGNVEGTFYLNLSYFLGVEKQWDNGRHSLSLSTFGSPVQRAQQSASVQEAYDITGNNLYNSYWGFMPDGSKRNQRVVTSFSPTAILSHIWKIDSNNKLTTGLAFSYNRYGSTALNWFNNAKDPRPDYYRYLPSYTASTYNTLDQRYQQDANFWNTTSSHIVWGDIYEANANNNQYGANKSALYIVEERRNDALETSFNTTLQKRLQEEITLTAGVNARYTLGKTFDVVADLLGANYLLDIDKYGERDFPGNNDVKQNDLLHPDRKVKEGDTFGYNYNTDIKNGSVWAQLHHNYEHVEVFYAGRLSVNSFFRDGQMKNGRDPLTSYGKGKVHTFVDPSVKAGVVYKINGRNLVSLNGMYKSQAPLPYDAYTKPRISDEAVPNLESEKIATADLNYVFTYPKLNGRLSGFYTNYTDGASKISYYNDSYSTFVHHSISDVSKRNYGVEAAFKYNMWKNISLSMAGSWSDFRYTSNPMGTVRYENGSSNDINEGVAIKNYHVGGSPEIAGTLSVQYFWRYWWFEVSINGIANNYLDPSYIQRTPSIIKSVRDAATAAGYDNVKTETTVADWLRQVKLDNAVTMDISISKLFYIKGGKQLNINLNASNILNNTGVRTGGYEQGRIPLYNSVIDLDNLNKFPAKFYYMQGFNLFLNIGFKF